MAASVLRPAVKATRGTATKGAAPRATPAGTALEEDPEDYQMLYNLIFWLDYLKENS